MTTEKPHVDTPQNGVVLQTLIPVLINWFSQNARKLPWREQPTPYKVWISEIMLQQTRVEAVKGYYETFLRRFPTLSALADADEEELAKCWQGLGYYSRMRNLHRCARLLTDSGKATLPSDYQTLLSLPGIGPYTAGAIASIAYGIPVPAVDGNVLRVLSHIFALEAPIDSPQLKTEAFRLLQSGMPKDQPGTFNQALMELGALVCLPNGAPQCKSCPVRAYCAAYRQNAVLQYPKKLPKKARRVEKLTFLLFWDGERILLRKRPPKGLLAGLWEYPNLPGHLSEAEASAHAAARGMQVQSIIRLPDAKHIFTHIEWEIRGYFLRCKAVYPSADEQLVTLTQKESAYAVPAAFDQYDLAGLSLLQPEETKNTADRRKD